MHFNLSSPRRRDPYAAAKRSGTVLKKQKRQWLWVPACAGTTATTASTLFLLLDPLVPLRQRAQPERVEADEAGGIAMIVRNLAFLERDEVLVVERIGALATDHRDRALVELERDRAGDELLAPIDRGLQHLALGREPEAVVDQLGVF